MYYSPGMYTRIDIQWRGQAEFCVLPVGVLAGFMYGSLDGEDSFHPRGFPLSPPGEAKGCLLIKIDCRKHEYGR